MREVENEEDQRLRIQDSRRNDGKVNFLEPMATLAFLSSGATVHKAIRQPQLFDPMNTYYPTRYNIWKNELGGNKKVQFRLYPKLNHMFQEGELKSVPDDYDKQANVPLYVINDLYNWIDDKK